MRYDLSELYQGMALAVPQSGETTDGFRGCGKSVVARSERAGLQSLSENVGSGKAAPPPAVRKPVAFRQATEPEELNLKPGSGRAEPFRTAGGAAAGEGSFHTDSKALVAEGVSSGTAKAG